MLLYVGLVLEDGSEVGERIPVSFSRTPDTLDWTSDAIVSFLNQTDETWALSGFLIADGPDAPPITTEHPPKFKGELVRPLWHASFLPGDLSIIYHFD